MIDIDNATTTLNDADWLTSVVAQVTQRPCVVEFERERSSTDIFFGSRNEPAHWRIVMKGIDHVARIDVARIKLRDDEHVRRRVIGCLPEAERAAS